MFYGRMLQWEVLAVVVWSLVSSSLPVMPSLQRLLVTLTSGDQSQREASVQQHHNQPESKKLIQTGIHVLF